MTKFQSSNVALPQTRPPSGRLHGFIPTTERDEDGRSYQYRRDQFKAHCAGDFGDLCDRYGLRLIDEREWPDLIAEREASRLRWSMTAEDFDLPNLDQNGTNYCWIFAAANSLRCARFRQTGQSFYYCPTSAGARITNFRNVGGWSTNGVRYMLDNGCNLVEDWPMNRIDRRYDTAENREKAKQHRILEAYFLDSYNESVSCQLQDVTVPGGHNWWRHAILHTDPIMVNGRVEQEIWNSWGRGWGRNGFGTLEGSRKKAEDYCAVVSVSPI